MWELRATMSLARLLQQQGEREEARRQRAIQSARTAGLPMSPLNLLSTNFKTGDTMVIRRTEYLRNSDQILDLQLSRSRFDLERVKLHVHFFGADVKRDHEHASPVDNWRL